jgi:hypothetical protein
MVIVLTWASSWGCFSQETSGAIDPQAKQGTDTSAPGSWNWAPERADIFWGVHHLDLQIQMAQKSQLAQRIYETSFWKKSSELLFKERGAMRQICAMAVEPLATRQLHHRLARGL